MLQDAAHLFKVHGMFDVFFNAIFAILQYRIWVYALKNTGFSILDFGITIVAFINDSSIRNSL